MSKKFFCALFVCSLLVSMFTSCQKDEEIVLPEVLATQTTVQSLTSGEQTLEIELSKPAIADLKVEFTVSGTATPDDYSFDNQFYSVKKGSSKGQLVVNISDVYQSGKTLEIEIVKGEGYNVGVCKFSYELTPVERVMYSFTQKEQSLVSETDIEVVIAGEISDDAYVNLSDKKFVVSVDPLSTAVEGTHFQFVGDKVITISKNNLTGTVTLQPIGDSSEYLGKNIKLIVTPEEGPESPLYYAGSNDKTNIVMTGFDFEKVAGKWKPIALVNYDYLVAMGHYDSDLATLPTLDADDYLEFACNEEGDNMITPTLTGDLKNFFTNNEGHKISFSEIAGEFTHWDTYEAYSIPFYTVEGVNAKFSASSTDTRSANIGFSYVDENTIYVYFFDYVPTDFMATMYEEYAYEFYADVFGLVYSFTRVQE